MNIKYNQKKAFDYENNFILMSKPYRLASIIAHYELYKKIIDLPGDVVELGVFKGNSLIQFSTFREILESEISRKIVGFDVFDEFPEATLEGDKAFRKEWIEATDNTFFTEKDIYKSLQIKGIGNVELIKGNIVQTLPEYVRAHPEQKIAFLHFDMDTYEPTKIGLDLLFEKVVRGGLIVFDDYGTVEGETKAVDEFLKDKDYVIHKIVSSNKKPGYIIKR